MEGKPRKHQKNSWRRSLLSINGQFYPLGFSLHPPILVFITVEKRHLLLLSCSFFRKINACGYWPFLVLCRRAWGDVESQLVNCEKFFLGLRSSKALSPTGNYQFIIIMSFLTHQLYSSIFFREIGVPPSNVFSTSPNFESSSRRDPGAIRRTTP